MSDIELTDAEFRTNPPPQEDVDLQLAVYDFPVADLPIESDSPMLLMDTLPAPDFVESRSSNDDEIGLDHVMRTRAELAGLIESVSESELAEHVWRVLEESHPATRDLLEIYMVIDDDDSVGRLAAIVLERMLEESPAVVAYFMDSAQAVRFFQTNTHGRIRGIVSDFHMPRLTGIDVLQAVRQLDHGREVPFVLMSGGLYGEDEQRTIRVLEEHGGKYEPKPFGLSALRQAIQRSLFGENSLN